MKWTLGILAILAMATVANAAISGTWAESTQAVVNGEPPAGYVVNDLLVTSDVDWTNSRLVVELTSGDIYQAPSFDSDFGQVGFWGLVAGLQWDTAVGSPGLGAAAQAVSAGDAITTSGIAFSWFDSVDTGAPTDAIIARVTASADAAGTWSVLLFDADSVGVPTEISGPIVEGAFIPEPMTLSLLGLGGLALLRRRR